MRVWSQVNIINGKHICISVIGQVIGDTTTWCIGITNLPEKFNNYNPREDESIMCDSDGKNCKHVQCFAVNTDADLLTGV